jgi:hypothetical protein
MKRLRALRDIYSGSMIRKGQVFTAEDNAARQYVRDGKAEVVPEHHPLVAANRRTKIVEGKATK